MLKHLKQVRELIDMAIEMRVFADDPKMPTAIKYHAVVVEEGLLESIGVVLAQIDEAKTAPQNR